MARIVLIVVAGVVVLAGLVATVVWLLTGLYHATKPEDLPGKNDSRWDRDQGRTPEQSGETDDRPKGR